MFTYNSRNFRSSKSLLIVCVALFCSVGSDTAAQPASLDTSIYADNQQNTYTRCLIAADVKPETGLEMARRWIRLKGGEPAEHCAAAALIGLGDPEEAALRMRTLAEKSNGAPSIRAGLWAHSGRAWMDAGDYGQALRSFNNALVLHDKDSEVYLDRALTFAVLDEYWSAIDDLNRVIDRHPNALEALVLRGSAYRILNVIDLASDDIDRALSTDPNSVDALLEKGLLAEAKGETDSARALWVRVLELAPTSEAGDAVRTHLERLDLKIEPSVETE
jgi:tetratricopeptide (TPR) repeat protein